MPRRDRRTGEDRAWTPKTELGKAVSSGSITSIDEIFARGLKIREPEIVDRLLPGLKSEIIFFGGSPGKGGGIKRTSTRRTARMHRSGRRFKISALVAVGAPGYLGLGKSVSTEHGIAIDKAAEQAKLNIIPVRRSCGSWECACSEAHSIPIKAIGKSGSVVATLLPAPKGLGLCIGDEGKKMLRLAGIRDVWTKILGQTRTRLNYTQAIYDAFKYLNKIKLDLGETKLPEAPPPEEPVIAEKEKDPEEEFVKEEELAEVLSEEVKEAESEEEQKFE